jgi:protein TonB
MRLMLASDDRDNTLSSFSASFATDIVELVVYTADDAFLHTLKSSAGDARRLWHVPSADKVADLLVAGQVGILVLDVQALGSESNVFIMHLKRQFPDLVLVVAGSRDAEIELAGLISDGTIYRFIHKPMSAARAKLFADAAVKKYLERRDRGSPPPVIPRDNDRRGLWAGAAIGLVAAGLLTTWFLRGRLGGTVPPAAIVAKPAAVESALTARAAAALAANRLTSPSGDNALDLYLQALAHDPADAAAQAGLTEVRERLWTLADNALLEERLDPAAAAIETARRAGVDGGRIALLTAQLEGLRARLKIPPADNRPQGEPQQRIAETGLNRFLNLVQARVKEGRLLEPDGDNARFYLQEAMRLDPKGSTVQAARQSVAAALLADARAAIDRRDFPHAANMLDAAAGIAAPAGIANVREQLRAALQRAETDRQDQMLKNAQERLRQDRLIEPPNDSAKYYLLTLRDANANYPGLGPALQELGQRLVANARQALDRKQYDVAHNWLDEASAVGFSSADSAALARDLEAAAAARQAGGPRIAASELTLLRSVKAVYPVGAQREKTEGWVELDFTVGETGDVKDIAVHASDPAKIFDNAAMRALSQWRYQPVVKDGAPIEQRSRVRIRFALAD